MIFLVYGEEKYLIDKFIKEEISRNNIEEVYKFDYTKDGIKTILEECSYNDLFSTTKAIILENSKFLIGKTSSEEQTEDNSKEDINLLNYYIDNPNENSFLFIVVNSKTLDERKNIVKKLKDKAHVRVYNSLKESESSKFIKEYLQNNNITIKPILIDKIIKRVGINLYALTNELDKIILYKIDMDEEEVTEQEIDEIISISLESDVFKLSNALGDRKIKEALNVYDDLIRIGTHPSIILALIANQYRLLYQVKVLSREGNSENDIVHELGTHPYQTAIALRNSLNYSEEELLDYIHRLALIDEDIKTSQVDINTIIESFLIYILSNK